MTFTFRVKLISKRTLNSLALYCKKGVGDGVLPTRKSDNNYPAKQVVHLA